MYLKHCRCGTKMFADFILMTQSLLQASSQLSNVMLGCMLTTMPMTVPTSFAVCTWCSTPPVRPQASTPLADRRLTGSQHMFLPAGVDVNQHLQNVRDAWLQKRNRKPHINTNPEPRKTLDSKPSILSILSINCQPKPKSTS